MSTFYNICINGDKKAVLDAVDIGVDIYWSHGLWGACCGGHIDIVNYIINEGSIRGYVFDIDDWNRGLLVACRHGHDGIAMLMLKNGAKVWHGGFFKACQYGHINIINMFFKIDGKCFLNHDDLNYGLIIACHNGNIDIVNFLIDMGACEWNDALIGTLCGTSFGGYTMCCICIHEFDTHLLNNGVFIHGEEEYKYLYCSYIQNRCKKLDNRDISILKLLISKGANINYIYPYDHKYIIELLELGLTINELHPITNISILANKLEQFGETTYNELYQYMPKELANIICEYCLL